ncbi:MAG: hypothetical protein JWM85_1628 [Acidimicrobiaceae bacterium]|nr:hypothetical protein [Acidimicrobiaceae bacterium]
MLATPPDQLASCFGAVVSDEAAEAVAPSWNVAPTSTVLGVRVTSAGVRELGPYYWGLVPSFAKGPEVGARMLNARAESIAERPAFRSAFVRRRLLVVADGFYEWKKGPGRTPQPFYFSRRDGAPLAFAGLFERWWAPGAEDGAPSLVSCTIVTTGAGEDLTGIHDRMPVVLESGAQERWLESAGDRDELESLLQPSPGGTLVAWPVDRRVGNVANDDPGMLQVVADPDAATDDPARSVEPLSFGWDLSRNG